MIQLIASTVFWMAVAGIFVTYIGFPYSLRFIARFISVRKADSAAIRESDLPYVTVLVPAYNEEKYIGARIDNLLESDYPAGKLQILIASDQSTDRTANIVQSYADRGVELIEMPVRSGKLGILDSVIPQAKHEIVLITDANVYCKKDAIRQLMKPYVDSEIGAVCGLLNRVPPATGKNVEGEQYFIGYEQSIKIGLSCLGKVIGAFGGFYSIRKNLFRPLGRTPVHDDVVIPLEVLAQGYKVIMAPEAISTEETLETISAEFFRRIRMAAYNFLSIPRVLRLGWQAGLLAFTLVFCYKLLRWVSPFLLILAAISLLVLYDFCAFYQISAMLASLVLSLALIGGFLDLFGKRLVIATLVYYFLVMNIAGIFGALRAVKGVHRYWEARE